MRHRKKGRKLSRSPSHRRMMLRNMVTSLIDHEKIQTTLAKGKEVRRLADKVIGLAKRGDLHARRQALAILTDQGVVRKLFSEIGPRFQDRAGGFTRIAKLDNRQGDAAPLSMIMLTEGTVPKTGTTAKRRTRKTPSKKAKTPRTEVEGKEEKARKDVEEAVDQGKPPDKRTTKGKRTRKREGPKKRKSDRPDSSQ